MNAYIAYGTKEHLEKIYTEKLHDSKNAYLLAMNDDAALIYESENTNPFNEENTYEIIETFKSFAENDFIIIKHILTSDEDAPIIKNKLKDLIGHAKDTATGLQGARIYQPIDAKKYILLTAWKSQKEFILWNNLDLTKEITQFINDGETLPQSLLQGGTFEKSYFVEKL